MYPTILHKYKYFHSTVQRAKDRPQKFHFCRLPFDVTSSLISLLSDKEREGVYSSVYLKRLPMDEMTKVIAVAYTSDKYFT